ncbi:MAG: hypothetical protein Q7S64_03085 [bacterium]|nr:hypothetical protein [bacterium]
MFPVKIKAWWWALLSVVVLGLVFWPWFIPGFLSYGDWWHILPSRAVEYYQHLLIFDAARNFGSPLSISAAHNAIHWWYGLLWQNFQVSPSITARLFWFVPFIVFAWVGAWQWGYLITKRRLGAFITALLYTLNSFSLNTVQGGQMTLAVSYALAPLTLYLVSKLVAQRQRSTVAWLSLTIAVQAIYDLRMLAITLLAGLLTLIYQLTITVQRERRLGKLAVLLVAVVVLAALLSAYWLWPILTGTAGAAGVPTNYTDVGWIGSLSYATVAHGLAANHVWWPWSEGILNPIQPLFYLTLLLALVSLWQWRRNRFSLLLFTLIVMGVFLLKGGNEPFAGTYAWLFTHVPGFILFRDPAKFFALLLLGLAPAAGLGALYLVDRLPLQRRILGAGLILMMLWLPLYPFWSQTRHGTFVPHQVPAEYLAFQPFLANDPGFSRSLWVPVMQRYIPYTQTHPAISLKDVAEGEWSPFKGADALPENLLNHPYADWLLDQAGVKWVGLPLDTENEIYRHYGLADYFLQLVAGKTWLKEVDSGAPAIRVFANEGAKDELYTAKQTVALDKELVAKFNPALTAEDLLLLSNRADGAQRQSSTSERLRGISLNLKELQLNGDTAVWQWQNPANFKGTLQFQPELAAYLLRIDNQIIDTKDVQNLTVGSHSLSLNFGNPPNLAYSGKFEETKWVPCQDARGRLIFPDSFYQADENGGKTNVQMVYSSEEAPGCMSVKLGLIKPGLYRVKALTRTESGIGLEAKFLHDDGELTGASLPKNSAWQELTILVEVNSEQPGELLLLANPTMVDGEVVASKVALADLTVQQLFNTVPEYIALTNSLNESTSTPPTINFERLKPGLYEGTVAAAAQPYYLVLNQAFNKGWRIKGVTPLEHLEVNGFANAWLLPANTQATQFRIEFGNKAPFHWGLLISLSSLIVVLFIGLKKKRQRFKR